MVRFDQTNRLTDFGPEPADQISQSLTKEMAAFSAPFLSSSTGLLEPDKDCPELSGKTGPPVRGLGRANEVCREILVRNFRSGISGGRSHKPGLPGGRRNFDYQA